MELTRREYEILKLVSRGLSNEDIGKELGISINTVKIHLSHILDKLYLKDRTQLVIYYFNNKENIERI